ncbi:MAG: hypothetical protein R2744_04665 [Bacteroidales bacterium]
METGLSMDEATSKGAIALFVRNMATGSGQVTSSATPWSYAAEPTCKINRLDRTLQNYIRRAVAAGIRRIEAQYPKMLSGSSIAGLR